MDNENEPLAQDPNAPDEQIEEGEGSGERSKNTVPQERVDEITAKYRDIERKYQASQEQILGLLTAQQTRVAAPVPEVDEYPDMDPAIKEMVRKSNAKATSALQAQLAATNARYESLIMAQEAETHATAMGGDDRIKADAKKYASELRKKDIPITSEEAAIFAMGLAVKEGRYAPPVSQTSQPARRGAAPIGNVRSPNFTPVDQQTQKPLPANFDSLTLDQQIAILEKRGAGDTKL